jgi:hypothetical protein
LLPDGRPRFRQVLVLVARQNGKTELLVLLSLFWLYALEVGLILGTSTKMEYSKESWLKARTLAQADPDLAAEIVLNRTSNGETELKVAGGSRYKIAAANEEGGRSLTISRLIEDEIRQHYDWSAHEAAENAMNAVWDAQAWAISNAGSRRSVVLNSLQKQGLEFIRSGEGDDRLGYFGWTAPKGCDVTDFEALKYANPNLGRRLDPQALRAKAFRAKAASSEHEISDQEIKFRTEVLCQGVADLEPQKISLEAWNAHVDPDRPVGPPCFFITVAAGSKSATIAAAAMRADGTPHVSLADSRPGVHWLMGRLKELHETYPRAEFATNDRGPVAAMAETIMAARIPLTLINGVEAARGCVHLEQLIDQGFGQSGDERFETALENAATKDIGDGLWAWDWAKSAGDISAIAAASGALRLLAAHPAPRMPLFAAI